MTVYNIKIYFDTVCPWCYIGDKVFDQALGIFKKTYPGASSDTFNIQWIPYYLDANAPTTGVPMEDKMAKKNGAERVNAIETRLQRFGRAHGIRFTFGGKVGNTRDSHRLIYAAGLSSSDVQRTLIDEVFRFFETDRDFTSHDDLLEAAELAGMPQVLARDVLESEQYGDVVDELAAGARRDGINSVPTFDINGARIEGADDPSAFYETFASIKEKEEGVEQLP